MLHEGAGQRERQCLPGVSMGAGWESGEEKGLPGSKRANCQGTERRDCLLCTLPRVVLSLLYSPEVKGCFQHSSGQVLYPCGVGLRGRQTYPRLTDNYPAQEQSLLGPLSLDCRPGLLLPVPWSEEHRGGGQGKREGASGHPW